MEGALATAAGAPVLSAPEAERLIESLREFHLEDVASAPWMEQRSWVEQLNVQARGNRPGERELGAPGPTCKRPARGAARRRAARARCRSNAGCGRAMVAGRRRT